MSLINQMLQELDARRGDTAGAAPHGGHIRAVPEQRAIHPAWWLALGLAIVLAGVLAWLLLRPAAAPASQPLKQPPKQHSRLAPAASQVSAQDAGRDSGQEKAAPASEARLQGQAMPPASPDSIALPAVPAVPAGAAPPGDAKPSPAPAVAPAPAELPDPAKQETVLEAPPPIAAIRPMPAAPAKPVSAPAPPRPKASAPTPAAPAAIHKQVKEFTPRQRAENAYRNAILLLQQGKTAEAIEGLELALKLDPKQLGTREALIGALLEQKHNDDAARIAREGLALDVGQPALAMILARLQLDKGGLHQALETLQRSLSYAVDNADYQAFLAALLQRDERHKEAVEHYLQALRLAPRNGVWWMGLGISLQAEHRLPEAADAFKRAKATNALSPELLAFVDGRLHDLPH